MTQKINFGVIGCGQIAPHHIGAIERIPEAKLAMVAISCLNGLSPLASDMVCHGKMIIMMG